MPHIKPDLETFARIKVIGIGGAGGNAISRMVQSKIEGVDLIAVNTDAQDLHHCCASRKIHIGRNLTKGLGAGMNPEIGRQAAEENKDELQEAIKGADMVFITCGLGGGTGTGASPIIAQMARELGALTIAVVTKPFTFEGVQRAAIAQDGLRELEDKVDSLITIPNDRVLGIIDKKVTLLQAFSMIDDILRQAVQGISDLIVLPGIINVDFADVRAIMSGAGTSLIGIGRAMGTNRAELAARQAVNSPLLETSIEGARGILFNVSAASSLGMLEVNEAAKIISEVADGEARIIFGAVENRKLRKGEMRITVIASGFNKTNSVSSSQNFLKKEEAAVSLQSSPEIKTDPKTEKIKKNNHSEFKTLEEETEWDVPAFLRRKK